jgi:tetratricopeptide (TPR) repeat protein
VSENLATDIAPPPEAECAAADAASSPRAEEERAFAFSFLAGDEVLAEFALGRGHYVVGSDLACEISVALDGIAPAHARLELGEAIFVEDLQTEHGTTVAGERIPGLTKVSTHQLIKFGNSDGALRVDRAPLLVAPLEEPKLVAPPPARLKEAPSTGGKRRGKKQKKAPGNAAKVEQPSRATPGEEPRDSERIANVEFSALEEQLALIRKEQDAALTFFSRERSAWQAHEGSMRERLLELSLALETAQQAKQSPRPTLPGEDSIPPVVEEPAADASAARDAAEAEELERLRSDLEAVTKDRDRLQQQAALAAARKASGGSEHAGLLSMANKVLFQKFSEAASSSAESAALVKQLKKREAALYEAWSQRQQAEERCVQLTNQLAALNKAGEPGSSSAPTPLPARRPVLRSRVIGIGASVLIGTAAVLGISLKSALERARYAEGVIRQVQPTAPELHAAAVALLEKGSFVEARTKLNYAIALEPNTALYYRTQGHVQQSLLAISAAAGAYQQALNLDPSDIVSQANLTLCRRLLGTRQGGLSPESQYALHALMMEQQRFSEALKMAERLASDAQLLYDTWVAVLKQANISGDLHLNPDGTFDLKLTSAANIDLSRLRGMPLRALNAGGSGVVDLYPLAGMQLRELDLSRTMVRDLRPLKGMPLRRLDLSNSQVSDLLPLRGMPLKELSLTHVAISSISDLRGMPLQTLRLAGTRVRDISLLGELPLRLLDLANTRVDDVKALRHLPLEQLSLEGTSVSDILPLNGARILVLNLSRTPVQSVEPLRGLPLVELQLAGCEALPSVEALASCTDLERLVLPHPVAGVAALRSLPSLRFLSYAKDGRDGVPSQTAQEFWRAEKPEAGGRSTRQISSR